MPESKPQLTISDLKPGDRIEIEVKNLTPGLLSHMRFATYLADGHAFLDEGFDGNRNRGGESIQTAEVGSAAMKAFMTSTAVLNALGKLPTDKANCWIINYDDITTIKRKLPTGDLKASDLVRGDRIELQIGVGAVAKATYLGEDWCWLDAALSGSVRSIGPMHPNCKGVSAIKDLDLPNEARMWHLTLPSGTKLNRLLPERSNLVDKPMINVANLAPGERVEVAIDMEDGTTKLVLATVLDAGYVWFDEWIGDELPTVQGGKFPASGHTQAGFVLDGTNRRWCVNSNQAAYTRITRLLDEKAKLYLDPPTKVIEKVVVKEPEPLSVVSSEEMTAMKSEITDLKALVQALVEGLKTVKPGPVASPIATAPKPEASAGPKVVSKEDYSAEDVRSLKAKAVLLKDAKVGDRVLFTFGRDAATATLCGTFACCKHTISATIIAMDNKETWVGWKPGEPVPADKDCTPLVLADKAIRIPSIGDYTRVCRILNISAYQCVILAPIEATEPVKVEALPIEVPAEPIKAAEEHGHDVSSNDHKANAALSIAGLAFGAMAGAMVSAMTNHTSSVRVESVVEPSLVEEAIEATKEAVS